VLQTGDPDEFIRLYTPLQQSEAERMALRRAGRATAKRYSWPSVLRSNLLPRLTL